jgi:hypothetical protein
MASTTRDMARMRATNTLLALSLMLGWAKGALAGDWQLPSDVGVTLAASPTTGLLPGQPIDVTFSVSNLGSEELPVIFTMSSVYVDEMQLVTINPDECFLYVLVGDLADGGYDYRIVWEPASPDFAPPLAPGETRVCHFQIALGASAPAAYDFSFGLPDFFHDPDPSNDRVTVVLHRAAAAPTQVPTLSVAMLWLLATLFAIVGMIVLKASGRASRRSSTLEPIARYVL